MHGSNHHSIYHANLGCGKKARLASRTMVFKSLQILLLAGICGCLSKSGTRPSPTSPPGPSPNAQRNPPKTAKPKAPSPSPPSVTSPESWSIGETKTIRVLEKGHIYWKSSAEDFRALSQDVDFPPAAAYYQSINLQLKLDCPTPSCDFWDRRGSVYLLGDDGQKVEIARFITPYRVGSRYTLDLSHLAPLLIGRRKIEINIDTYVGPGHPQGAGWLVSAEFQFVGGRPATYPVAVIPIFASELIDVGDPAKSPKRVFTGTMPDISYSSSKLFAIVTGHGQGNSENCAEFCRKTHTFTVNGTPFSKLVWRANCSSTVTDQRQQGTWTLARAGWCPGAAVETIAFPMTSLNKNISVTYEPEAYTNARRTGYNDQSHTQPVYQVSSVLVLYGS